MTKKEIIEAIENNESVWGVSNHRMYELKADNIEKIGKEEIKYLEYNENYHLNLEIDLLNIYKTKAEAEHYLHHANITRTEQLPFLTWEEFLEETRLKFIACDGVSNMILYYCDNTIYLVDDEYPEFNTTSWELTEENFYKAYDECVRLFKGKE